MTKTYAPRRQRPNGPTARAAAPVQREDDLANLVGRTEHHGGPREVLALQQTAGNGAVQRLLASSTTVQRDDLEERLARRAAGVFSGKSAVVAGVGGEGAAIAAPGAAIGGAQGLGDVMSGGASTSLGSTTAVSEAGGAFGAATGGLGTIAGAGLIGYGLYKRHKAGKDKAMRRLGARTARGGGWLLAGGAAGTALGGLEIAAKTGAAGAALAPAAFGLMVAGGAITAGKGLWKLGKSLKRLSDLGDVSPTTEEGRMWLAKAKDRAKTKAGVAGFKTVLGGLGIAAGALLLASNPIGWAIGIGAALIGGIAALASMRNKAKQVGQDAENKKGISDAQKKEIAEARKKPEAKLQAAKNPAEKKKAQEELAKATAAAHSNLQVGMAMRSAALASENAEAAGEAARLGRRQGETEAPFRRGTNAFRLSNRDTSVPTMKDFQAFDALQVASGMNISAEELRSASGAKLVQEKLAAADAS